MKFKEYLKLCEQGKTPVVKESPRKPLKKAKTQEEIDLINKLKVLELTESDKVYLKALNILKRKHQERLAEYEAQDVELSATIHKKVDVEDYFQKLIVLADKVGNDIEADKVISSKINVQTIRDLAKKERQFAEKPDTATAKEFYGFRRAFIKYLGTEPSEKSLKKMLKQDYKASQARMQESLYEKAFALVKGKSFNRLLSECKLKSGQEDALTEVQLKPLIEIEKQSQLNIKANRILSLKEFMEC